MRNSPARGRPLLVAASILLALATLVEIALIVRFFYSPPVRVQLDSWARDLFRGQAAAETSFRAGGAGGVLSTSPSPEPSPSPLPPENTPTAAAPLPAAVEETAAPAPAPTPEPRPSAPEGKLIITALEFQGRPVKIAVRDGAWDLAGLGAQVGWLETTGTHPGDDLAMVMIGHVTLPPPGGPGPFLNLHKLKPGDEILYRTDETLFVYRVERQLVVAPEDVDKLYQRDGSKLLLVTCTGWDAIDYRYERRLLVEATLVRAQDLTREYQ